MPQAEVRMLNGSILELESSGLPVERKGATNFAAFRIGGSLQEFGAGDADFGDAVAGYFGITFTEEYRLLGSPGVLRVGSRAQVDSQSGHTETLHLGVWQGKSSAIRAVVYDGSSAELIALFDRFRVDESPIGATISPRDFTSTVPAADVAQAPAAHHLIRGLGDIDVSELTTKSRQTLPRHRGSRVRGGELYNESTTGHHAEKRLLLVGSTAISRIAVEDAIAESKAIDAASDLRVSWKSP